MTVQVAYITMDHWVTTVLCYCYVACSVVWFVNVSDLVDCAADKFSTVSVHPAPMYRYLDLTYVKWGDRPVFARAKPPRASTACNYLQ